MVLEPGRSIIANAGYLITRVQYLKNNDVKNFAIVDAGMNDMLRPALYQAWMDIQSVNCDVNKPKKYFDIVGPVCESSDFLGLKRLLSIVTVLLPRAQSAAGSVYLNRFERVADAIQWP